MKISIAISSGKGGTGKTSLVASFCALEKNIAISDCDVDASDLHILLKPKLKEKGNFSGGEIAVIDPDKCRACGACLRACQFNTITEKVHNSSYVYHIDEHACEGCGVCELVCSFDAVSLHRAINGEWFISQTDYGPMSHAKLGASEENSDKLVTHIRNQKNQLARIHDINHSIIDGSPRYRMPGDRLDYRN